jgi:hypothetical protein
MSKERARLRAQRQAQQDRERAARARKVARRDARRRVVRRLTPRLPDRRTGRLYPRRTRTQRAAIAVAAVIVIGLIWLNFDDLATRIALTGLVVLASPALIVLTLDRR